MENNIWNKKTLLTLGSMLLLLAGIVGFFLVEKNAGDHIYIYGMIAVAVIIIAIGAMYVYLLAKGKIQQTGPDYRMFFYLGLVFLPLAISNPSCLVFSVMFIALGLANKNKWKPEQKWSKMPPAQRNFKIGVMIVLGLLVIAGFVVWYLGAR